MTQSITLPNGNTIDDVPDDATKDQVKERAIALGLAKPEDFGESTIAGVPVPQLPEETKSLAMNVMEGAQSAAEAGGEAMLTMGSGLIAEPVAGWAGLLAAGAGADMERITRVINNTRDALTYHPKTEGGQATLDALGAVFAPISEAEKVGSEQVGGVIGLLGGSEQAQGVGAAAVPTAIEGAMMLFGPLSKTKAAREMGRVERGRDVRRLRNDLNQQGLDPSAPRATREAQIEDFADRQVAGQARGASLVTVQEALKRQRDVEKAGVDAAYATARSFEAGVDPVRMRDELIPQLTEDLKFYDTKDMPIVQRRLKELDDMGAGPLTERQKNFIKIGVEKYPSSANLRDIDDFRKRLVKNRSGNLSEDEALDIIKHRLDAWMDHQFDADMISGDRQAVMAWKGARGAHTRFMERFSDEKFIRDVVSDEEWTPEQMRSWLMNTSDVGFKTHAGRVVKKIRDILGEDSTGMQALRNEFSLNLLESLLNDSPRPEVFARNFRKFKNQNPTLYKELYTPDQKKAWETVASFSKAHVHELEVGITEATWKQSWWRWPRALAVLTMGNRLAKASLRVNATTSAIGLIRHLGSTANQRIILSQMLGYDYKAPLLSVKGPAAIGAFEELKQQPQEGQ